MTFGTTDRQGFGNLLAQATVAGFGAGVGASAGRDLYRLTKRNFLLVAALTIAFAGTGFAVRDTVRGNRRGLAGIVFRTCLLNVTAILLSLLTTALIATALSGNRPDRAATFFVVIQGASALTGLVIGLAQRRNRVRAFRVAAANERFLRDTGLCDVGGRDQTLVDTDGNELMLDDIRRDAIVFRVRGRRGGRALIRLDGDGRMIEYAASS